MNGIISIIVILFWVVGIVTGMVATVFLLELEDRYLFQPAKDFIARIKILLGGIPSQVSVSARRASRFVVETLHSHKRKAVHTSIEI